MYQDVYVSRRAEGGMLDVREGLKAFLALQAASEEHPVGEINNSATKQLMINLDTI